MYKNKQIPNSTSVQPYLNRSFLAFKKHYTDCKTVKVCLNAQYNIYFAFVLLWKTDTNVVRWSYSLLVSNSETESVWI